MYDLVPQTSFYCGVKVLFHWMWYWRQVKFRTVVQVFMYWLGVTGANSVYLHQMANHPAFICALTACQTWLCYKVECSSFSLYTVNIISPRTTYSWIIIFVVPRTTFQSTNQILRAKFTVCQNQGDSLYTWHASKHKNVIRFHLLLFVTAQFFRCSFANI